MVRQVTRRFRARSRLDRLRDPERRPLLRVEGGGHNWPSLEPLPAAWRGWSGTHNRDIESAEEIWAFLRQFRKGDAQP